MWPEPCLWWAHQTGTVCVCQSASCEPRLCLVRLDWHSASTRCHLLLQMLRTWLGSPEREIPEISDRPFLDLNSLCLNPIYHFWAIRYASRQVFRNPSIFNILNI